MRKCRVAFGASGRTNFWGVSVYQKGASPNPSANPVRQRRSVCAIFAISIYRPKAFAALCFVFSFIGTILCHP